MSFSFEITEKLQKKLNKLAKRDFNLAFKVRKKISQIISLNHDTINHLKNLKGSMSHLKRVHIGSFVLLFYVKEDTIYFEDFVHHDQAYT
ncbi:MAG: addiction module toxin RelE [Nanoarchaeota archaeon]|nr:addiction module toxin RelE [Nanoarchaeota archaeon]